MPQLPFEQLVAHAVTETVLTREEAALLTQAERARDEVIQVDSFTDAEYFATADRSR